MSTTDYEGLLLDRIWPTDEDLKTREYQIADIRSSFLMARILNVWSASALAAETGRVIDLIEKKLAKLEGDGWRHASPGARPGGSPVAAAAGSGRP